MPAEQWNAVTTKHPFTTVCTKLVRPDHALHLQLRPSNSEGEPSSSPYQIVGSLRTFTNDNTSVLLYQLQ